MYANKKKCRNGKESFKRHSHEVIGTNTSFFFVKGDRAEVIFLFRFPKMSTSVKLHYFSFAVIMTPSFIWGEKTLCLMPDFSVVWYFSMCFNQLL